MREHSWSWDNFHIYVAYSVNINLYRFFMFVSQM